MDGLNIDALVKKKLNRQKDTVPAKYIFFFFFRKTGSSKYKS